MQCNLITYFDIFISTTSKASAGNIRTQSIYNVTAINRRRQKAGHLQRLLQPAWHLRGLLPDHPFVRQVVALEGTSVRAEGNRQTSHVRISVWMAC